MKKTLAMVLVGGRGTRLERITLHTAKPAVSFGGKYKLIDFVLSNLTNSGIGKVGIITQYEPYELMNYIEHGSTWDLDVNDGGISFLTPYTTIDGDQWQKGTAHAIMQHFRYIEHHKPEDVLILGGDHIYKMNYNDMIKHHQKNNADLTIATFTPNEDLSRFGIINADENDFVTSFEEKPKDPKSTTASMGIYVFKTDVLKTLVTMNIDQNFDFGKDIIPLALKKGMRVVRYHFDGYFRDVGTVESLYEEHMNLLDNPQYLKLHDYQNLPIFTKSSNLPPHHIAKRTLVRNSMISDGCIIHGEVKHSILSSKVVVKNKAKIEDCVVFSNVKIGENAIIKKAIIMDDSVILANTELIFEKVTVIDNDYLWKLGEQDGQNIRRR
ncbi:MAG: glucose-1-phosphate adenylyltransferase family protein [Candidatus Izemoplasmataceae bacterium]